MPASQGLWGPEWVCAARPAPTPRLRVRGRWELPAQCQEGMWGWRPGSLGGVCMRGTRRGGRSEKGFLLSHLWGVGPGKQRPCYRKTKGDLPRGPSQGSQATRREGPAFSWVSPETTRHCISPILTTVLLLEVNSTVHGCGPSCQWPVSAPKGLLPEEHPGRHALLSLGLRALCSPGPKGKIHVFRKIQ